MTISVLLVPRLTRNAGLFLEKCAAYILRVACSSILVKKSISLHFKVLVYTDNQVDSNKVGVFPFEVDPFDLAGKLTPLRSRTRGVLDSVPTLFVSVKQFVYTDPP